MPSIRQPIQERRHARQERQIQPQRLDLHFRHHPVAIGFDGTFGPTYRAGDRLVGLAANDNLDDLPLARRQCLDAGENDIQFVLQVA